jgi:hypothetical protein
MIQECLAIGDDLDGLDAEIEDRVATKELAARGRRIRFLGGISICLMALVTVALVLGLISRLRAGRLSDRSRTIWGGSYSGTDIIVAAGVAFAASILGAIWTRLSRSKKRPR